MDLTFFMGIVLSLLLAVCWDELAAWMPRLTLRIVSAAAARLPRVHRARFDEEWRRHVEDTPGTLAKLLQACQCLLASERMVIGPNRLAKRLIDLALALPTFVFLAPLLMIVVIAIKADAPGPAIFKKRRKGRHGSEIFLFRFRTAPTSDDSQSASKLGYFLQRTSIDYLPHLVNVIRGELSYLGINEPVEWAGTEARVAARPQEDYPVKPGIVDVRSLFESEEDRRKVLVEYLTAWSVGLEFKLWVRAIKWGFLVLRAAR